MANDVRWIKGMEDIATCGICNDLYMDARTLTCQHCFCLKCLYDYQTSALVKQCPICRAETVPAVRELHLLPPNKALNEMVDQMVKLKANERNQPTANQPTASQPTANQPTVRRTHMSPGETSQTTGSRVRTSKPTSAPRPQTPPSSNSNGGLFGMLGAVLMNETVQEKTAEVLTKAIAGFVLSGIDSSEDAHEGVQCDECHTTDITGVRYKCGVCADYDLCERCERKPRVLVHDMKHIFVKLRRPATCRVASGQMLHPVGYSIGQQMRFDSSIHAELAPATRHGLSIRMNRCISCDRCGESPIEGIRFKCGMCDDYDLCASCESDSPSFHPRNHVFLVIPHPSNAPFHKGRLLRVDFY